MTGAGQDGLFPVDLLVRREPPVERWTLAAARPLAWGGREFVLTGPAEKRLEWFPNDAYLLHQGRPFLGARVVTDSPKGAKAAAVALVAALNEDMEAVSP
jgi:hypothetical protein